MRVTFVLPYAGMSGGVRVAAIYAAGLHRRGHTVHVVSQPMPAPSWRDRARAALRGRFLWNYPSAGSHFEGSAVPHRVLGRHRPVTNDDVPDADVIVATWWETAEWISTLSPAKGARAYLLQHDEVVIMPERADRIRATWRLPLHKIVVAKWLADLAAREFGDPHASLIPNAVDHQQFDAPARGKQPVPTVGFMYAVPAWKGCDVIQRAIEEAASRLPRLRAVAFGTVPRDRAGLPAMIEYTVRPPQDMIAGIYASCDAWLFGSRSEGFGLPILEAMACRTPVIGTPVGAAPELLADGAGILVGAQDAAGMARAIERIAAMDEPAWRGMSDRAYGVASRYSWDQSIVAFEEALEQAAGRSGRPGRATVSAS